MNTPADVIEHCPMCSQAAGHQVFHSQEYGCRYKAFWENAVVIPPGGLSRALGTGVLVYPPRDKDGSIPR